MEQPPTVEIEMLSAEPAVDLAEIQMGTTALSFTGKRAPDTAMEDLFQGLNNMKIGGTYDASLLKELWGKHPTIDLNPFAYSGAIIPKPKIAWGEIDVHAVLTNERVPDLPEPLQFLDTLGRTVSGAPTSFWHVPIFTDITCKRLPGLLPM